MAIISGTGVALITPFNNNYNIDYEALEKLINYVISGGVDYIVMLGTTGESVVLSSAEKIKVTTFFKEINKDRVPLVSLISFFKRNILTFIARDINRYFFILNLL